IIAAAKKLFLRDGIDKTTVAQVAREALLSSMSVYRYFGNKQAIAVAVANHLLREYLEEHRKRCAEAEQPRESGHDAFARIVRAYVATYEAHPEYMDFLQDMGFYSMREGLSYHLDYMQYGSIEVDHIDRPAQLALNQGLEDGSIRKDIDIGQVSLTLANLLTGGIHFRGLIDEQQQTAILRHTAEMIIYYTKEARFHG
ncbi:MAG: helix-turn-helix transcriptional regulator, partial [Oscillospiraceae bacterium]|nr:helix-turn-helix transcriptional regulator [Oscillospiraceae bacterium]